MANGPPEEGAYQCFFNRDDLPSPMEGGTLCDFPLAQLSGFPDHEEHFPLYTGARLEDMVESIISSYCKRPRFAYWSSLLFF